MSVSKLVLSVAVTASLCVSGCISTAEGILDSVAGGIENTFFSLSADECAVDSWHQAGYAAAKNDRQASYIDSYNKYCPKHGVTVDATAFNAGHAQGLKDYCTADLGKTRGESVFAYSSPCDSISTYKQAYSEGTKVRAEKQLSEAESSYGECKASSGVNAAVGGGVSIVSGRELTGAGDRTPGDPDKYASMVSGIEASIREANAASERANSYSTGSSEWRKWSTEFKSRYATYAQRRNDLTYYMADHCIEGVTSVKVFDPIRTPNGLRRK